MKKLLNLVVVLALIILQGASVLSKAQQDKASTQDVIKISAELVQVDVVVTDKNKQPVSGLKRGDFELYDNGKLQNITTFVYEDSRSRRIEEDTEQARTLPKAITIGELRRTIAFVVDTLHMRHEDVYRTQKMLADFIDKKMEPGDLVLIIATAGGSGLFQQFTSDPRLLHRAVSRLRPFIFSNDALARRSVELPASPNSASSRGSGFPQGGIQQRGFGIPDKLEEFDVRSTLFTLNNVIKSLGKLPGRKIGIFVSEGFRILQTQTTSDLADTTSRAQRANVIFYSIDPRGLDYNGLSAADNVSGQDVTDVLNQQREDLFEAQSALTAIALDTGGKFYRNNNEIKRGLDEVMQINSSYYLLGFQPEEGKWDGRFHKLKVVVRGRPELTVVTRKGYTARAEKKDDNKITNPKVAEVVEALSSPLVRRDIDLQLTPFYRDNVKHEPVTTTLLHIDATRLKFKQEDGRYKTNLDLVGFVFDAKGNLADRFSNVIELNFLPKTYQEALKHGLLSSRTMNLKPGVYQLRVFVREIDSGLIGTANNYVEIPDLKADRLALSSIFTDAQAINEQPGTDQSSTLSQRRYQRNSQISYLFLIYNAKSEKGQPQLEMSLRVLQGGRVAFSSPSRAVQALEGSTPPSRIIAGGALQLNNLAPGDYTLEVSVKDKLEKKSSRNLVRQEIDFSIE